LSFDIVQILPQILIEKIEKNFINILEKSRRNWGSGEKTREKEHKIKKMFY